MSSTIEELFEYCLLRNKNLTKENICQISSYLIFCSLSPLRCPRTRFSNYEFDLNSSTSRCLCIIPDYGIDCECNEKIMNYDWFESKYSNYPIFIFDLK